MKEFPAKPDYLENQSWDSTWLKEGNDTSTQHNTHTHTHMHTGVNVTNVINTINHSEINTINHSETRDLLVSPSC